MGKSKEVNSALTNEIEVSRIQSLQERIDENGDIIDKIVSKIVAEYCQPLDDYMSFIRSILEDTKNPPTDVELDDFTLNLPVLLYFTGEAQEALGIKEDVAKAIKQELYNETYEESTGTIADKTAAAELATQAEFIAHFAYQRAYKKVKLRMDAANEMLQSVKKVISRRIAEYEIAGGDPARVGGKGWVN